MRLGCGTFVGGPAIQHFVTMLDLGRGAPDVDTPPPLLLAPLNQALSPSSSPILPTISCRLVCWIRTVRH